MATIRELVNDLYLEIKEHRPKLLPTTYDNSGTIYYGEKTGLFGQGNNFGYKYFRRNGYSYISAKSDLKRGSLSDNTFLLPHQFAEARKAILDLYGIVKNTNFFDLISKEQKSLIVDFVKALSDNNIMAEETVRKTQLGYKSPYDDSFAAFTIGLAGDDKKTLVVKVKKFAPLKNELNQNEAGIASFDIKKDSQTNFSKIIENIKKFYETNELFKVFTESKSNKLIHDTAASYGQEVTSIYATELVLTYFLSEKKKLILINRNGDLKIKAVKNANENEEFELSDDAIYFCFSYLYEGLSSPPTITAPITNVPPTPKLSRNAQNFINEINSLPTDVKSEYIQILFYAFDELEEEDLQNNKVKEAYQFLCSLHEEKEDILPQSLRFVYVSKSFLKQISGLDADLIASLSEIKKSLNVVKNKNLGEYLKSKQLVYIEDYLKIRVRNGYKHRILFCFGDKIGKSPKDLYLFDYNTTHNFSNISDLQPSNQHYELWTLEKEAKPVPPLTEKQEKISNSVDKPLICTGCAGSGKTLISVYMYCNLLEKEFESDPSVDSKKLVYVTYNDNAKNNALIQLREIIGTANTKTVYEFFHDIAKPDLVGLRHSTFDEFFHWWRNDIHDYSFIDKINRLSSYNVERYVYTFYRGLYKGSMYRWGVNIENDSLTKEQFFSLMKNEPVEDEKIDLIWQICERYRKYQKEKKFYDDNDLARKVIRRINKGFPTNYQHIIIDEVQDLTEVQLDAVVKCSKDKRKLYFFGDQNQSINPTLFDVNNIQMCLEKNNTSIKPDDIYELHNSYRFGPLLAKYINHLVGLKRDWIGTTGINETESSNKHPEKNRWAGRSSDARVVDDILLKASNSANAIIIVPDNSTKEELRKKYGDDFVKRVITIYDSKGLEWDYVILYKMLQFNEDKFVEMMNGKGKKSTLHRMVFNQFYVGCTRAATCFSVIEPDLKPSLEKIMIGSLQKILPTNIGLYIEENTDAASWLMEAERLFEQGAYELAKNAYERAGVDPTEDFKVELCDIMCDENKKSSVEHAVKCKQSKNYREASLIYMNAGNGRLSKLMDLYLGINQSDADVWDIIMNEQLDDIDLKEINRNGFLSKKSLNIKTLMSKLLQKIKENK